MLKQFIGGADLADDLVHPVPGHMAVRAYSPDPGAVGVMDGVFIFPVDVVSYLMAGNAEGLGIGQFHGPVESSP